MGKEARREGGDIVWMLVFFFILAKSPTALSLNSKDLCNCVAQGAAQHWSLTRADAAARGTWFALNGSWLGSGTHVVRY